MSVLKKSPFDRPNWRTGLALALLSSAALIFEVDQTRLFSVAQFYHFAFMIISMALLGYGASGAILILAPGLTRRNPAQTLGWFSLATGYSIIGAYLLANRLPLDSFRIAWDARQVVILVLNALALASPFLFSGLVTGLLLENLPQSTNRTYAYNMVGSALGCLVALLAPSPLGGEGTLLLSATLAVFSAAIFFSSHPTTTDRPVPMTWVSHNQDSFSLHVLRDKFSNKAIDRRNGRIWLKSFLFLILSFSLLAITGADFLFRLGHRIPSFWSWSSLQISPYKGLSYALQLPDSHLIFQRWNSFSRVDVVRSDSIRSLPGLSYRYQQDLPRQDGLLVDGDDLSPILDQQSNADFAAFMPSAIAYQLQPGAHALILEPRGGLDVVIALANGASTVTAVEANPLIVEAAGTIYTQPQVRVVVDSNRSYLRRTGERFDVVVLSLISPYHPVRSGAYSLAEDYRYTIECFTDLLSHLKPEGLLVVSRWQQSPPNETLRTFNLIVTALERAGFNPATQIAALRGYNLTTFLVKKSPFKNIELQAIRQFAANLAFDLSYLPGLRMEETNRYNILPEPVDYLAFQALVNEDTRLQYTETYSFDITPTTDDRPFFDHFFTWSQSGQVLAEMGKTWAPFGGAGYFVILIVLGIALLLSSLLILLPALLVKQRLRSDQAFSLPGYRSVLFPLYFGLLGFAYLLVEIPLIQRFILYLGHPAYSLSSVLFILLLFSGLGSRFSRRIPLLPSLALLAILLAFYPWFLSFLDEHTLHLALMGRMILSVMVIAPLGFLMGIPFPSGLQQMSLVPTWTSWAWGVNGATSVISAVLAALLALTFGFTVVLRSGAICYAAACLIVWLWQRRSISLTLSSS